MVLTMWQLAHKTSSIWQEAQLLQKDGTTCYRPVEILWTTVQKIPHTRLAMGEWPSRSLKFIKINYRYCWVIVTVYHFLLVLCSHNASIVHQFRNSYHVYSFGLWDCLWPSSPSRSTGQLKLEHKCMLHFLSYISDMGVRKVLHSKKRPSRSSVLLSFDCLLQLCLYRFGVVISCFPKFKQVAWCVGKIYHIYINTHQLHCL